MSGAEVTGHGSEKEARQLQQQDVPSSGRNETSWPSFVGTAVESSMTVVAIVVLVRQSLAPIDSPCIAVDG